MKNAAVLQPKFQAVTFAKLCSRCQMPCKQAGCVTVMNCQRFVRIPKAVKQRAS